jgi:hypothetical protein
MYITPNSLAATLVVSWLTMFLVGTELFVFSPLLPMLAADYGVSPMLAGWSETTDPASARLSWLGPMRSGTNGPRS